MENYRVVRVVDGDSLDLKDERRIRLLSLDAPDRDRCLYDEARERLKELVLGKRVKLADVVIDDYGRILANVFLIGFRVGPYFGRSERANSVFVNKILIEEGLAKFTYVSSPYYEELKETAKEAKQEKRGIYSSICRSTEPIDECNIKGNTRHGDKVYHLPHCKNYKQVIIDEAFGDRWFCSEEEAQKEGFRKAGGC